ncbi:MAG: ribokinase [Beutenbergiaceae bacterium]
MSRVVVFGSANVDLVVQVDRRPQGGETLLGSDVVKHPGGKGANQAAAAARSGSEVVFLGAVGADDHGSFLRQSLANVGVDTDGLAASDRPTGTAMILVTPDGENSIVVSPGANFGIDVSNAEDAARQWHRADVLVLNLEIPLQTVEYLAQEAAAEGIRVLLNAAPAYPLAPELFHACDPLVVNEHEARTVLGEAAGTADTAQELAAGLLQAGARSVVITLGAQGAVMATATGSGVIPAYDVPAVDTTGAGDAFVGATAALLADGRSLQVAVEYATAMSALAVQRPGAQSSYANREDVEAFVAARRPQG